MLAELLRERVEATPESRVIARGVWRDALLRRILAVADVLAGLAVTGSFVAIDSDVGTAFWSATFVPVWIVLAKLYGLYDRDQRALRYLTVDELPRLCAWAATGTAALLLYLDLTPASTPSLERGFEVWAVAAAAACALRGAGRWAWRRSTPAERTLLVGSGAVADATRRKLELFPDIHLTIVAERPDLTAADLRQSQAWLDQIDRVLIAAQSLEGDVLEELVFVCRRAHLKLAVVPPVRGMFGTAVQLSHIADLPVIVYGTWDIPRSTLMLKRAMDLTLSVLLLVVLSPLLLALALAVKTSNGPVLFHQTRVGANGRPFRMLKFRTMVCDAEDRLSDLVDVDRLPEPVFKLVRDPRVTRVGRVLRRTSLDELPQLWNVVRGDMSLVGPRPEEEQIVARYLPEHRVRLGVKPGMTGPMQVNGRGELRFDERLAVEREYIENLSIARDVRILAMTAAAVLGGRGAF